MNELYTQYSQERKDASVFILIIQHYSSVLKILPCLIDVVGFIRYVKGACDLGRDYFKNRAIIAFKRLLSPSYTPML